MSGRQPIDVSILIVSYNTQAMTLACLDSIRAETRDVATEIVVVDNNSPDGSAAAIAAHAQEVRLIARPDNLGFARANNVAAIEARGEFILLLNPDTIVRDHAIDRLVAFARRRPDAMIWGGRTIYPDGTLNDTNCFRHMGIWNLICRVCGLAAAFPASGLCNSEAYGGWDRGSERDVDIVTGCFLLIPRALWERLGGFDPAFFMYGEEVDLCLRAARLGARPAITPEATIVHYGGASETTRAEKMVKVLAAKSTLIRRHWALPLRPLGLALLVAWPASRCAGLGLLGFLGRLGLTGAGAVKPRTAWREVWRRRAEWLVGYPAKPMRESSPASAAPALTSP